MKECSSVLFIVWQVWEGERFCRLPLLPSYKFASAAYPSAKRDLTENTKMTVTCTWSTGGVPSGGRRAAGCVCVPRLCSIHLAHLS